MVSSEEFQCFRDSQVQDIVDIQAFESHVEDVVLKPVSVTGFTLQHEVGHELHLHGDYTGALTFIASSAVGIEREILRRKAHLFR